MTISGPQLRAARNYLDWTRNTLAKATRLSPETIKNIEHGKFRPQAATESVLKQCFLENGIEFTENDGVRKVRTCPNCGWSEHGGHTKEAEPVMEDPEAA